MNRSRLSLIFLLLTACGSNDSSGGDANPNSDAVAVDASRNDSGTAGVCEAMSCRGGDPVGVWSLSSTCVNFPDEVEDCGTSHRRLEVEAASTLTINSDFSFSRSYTLLGKTTTTDFPAACVPQGVASCEEWQDSNAGACSGDLRVGCSCALVDDEVNSVDESGTWSVMGSNLVLNFDSGDGEDIESFEFCASENQLYMTAEGVQSFPIGLPVFYHWVPAGS